VLRIHHKRHEKGWETGKNAEGITEWWPPPHLDRGQSRINRYHHPRRYLKHLDDDDEGD
jgi:hypothetical protein